MGISMFYVNVLIIFVYLNQHARTSEEQND
jgi:hypothetical protein